MRQVVGLDLVRQRELADPRDQPPVAADDAFEQAVVAEPVEAALGPVALPGGEEDGQIARMPRLLEAPLQRHDQLFGRTIAHEAGVRQGIAIANDRNRFVRRDDLVLHAFGPLIVRLSGPLPVEWRRGPEDRTRVL